MRRHDVVRTPPRWAERLLRWSLAPDERAAVLGDVQEEFAALADQSPARATRWYWRQTLVSVIPNIARQIRNQWAEARQVVDEQDRRGRRRRLIGGLAWIGFCGVLFGALATANPRHADDWREALVIVAVPGLLATISSRYRAIGVRSSSSVRGRVFAILNLAQAGLMLLHRTPGLLYALWAMLIVLWMWPRAMWPFRRTLAVRGYSVRSPNAAFRSRFDQPCATVVVPPEAWAMSPLLVGTAGEPLIPATPPAANWMFKPVPRGFASDASLHLFTVVNANPEGMHGTLEIRRADATRALAAIPATVRRATPQLPFRLPYGIDSDSEPPLLSTSPMSELDVNVSLAGLGEGKYNVRLAATSPEGSATQDAEIVIWAGVTW